MDPDRIVFIVAGDAQARRRLVARMKELRLPAKACHSAAEFLALDPPAAAACIVLDVSQPPIDLELLRRLGPAELHLPVVAVSEAPDVPTVVEAVRLGARDFLEGSCGNRRLGEAIEEGFRWHAARRREIALVERTRRRLAQLTPGCREVLDLLVAGRSNRQIAEELDLSVRAIEERRAKAMRAMRARSLAELVRLAVIADGLAVLRREPDEG
ncbi:MAG: LuxR C-terminal-related transcriptional regulator [Thermoguttaceae bacterium]|jgi:FixJ family two-component response regulator